MLSPLCQGQEGSKVKWGLWLSWHCCNQTWKHKLSATWANSCNSIRNVTKTILKWNFFKRVSGKESLSSRIDRVKAALTLSLSVTSNLMMTLEDGHIQDGVLEVDENQISPFALFSHKNGYHATVKSLKQDWKSKLNRLNYLFFFIMNEGSFMVSGARRECVWRKRGMVGLH